MPEVDQTLETLLEEYLLLWRKMGGGKKSDILKDS